MAYIKREKYTLIDDNDLKKDLLKSLLEKGTPSGKARQLIFYPTPMSLIRWGKWLDPAECSMYLEPVNEDNQDSEDNDYMGF